MIHALIGALRFLTRIPLPGRATTTADLAWAVGWFPVVGAICGAVTGLIAVLAAPWWGSPIAAVLAVAVGLVLTGGFHEDAASDAADGLGGGFTTERILAIMHDSRVGAYGAMTLWVLLSLRALLIWRLLNSTADPTLVVVAIALACTWGRWTAAPLLAALPPLSDGLAKDLVRTPARGPVVLATGLALALTAAALLATVPPILLGTVIATALATTAAWGWYLRQRLGGQSGDLLGAGNQLVEIVVLLVLTAA